MSFTFNLAGLHSLPVAHKMLTICLLGSLLAACGGAGSDTATPVAPPPTGSGAESTFPGTTSRTFAAALTVPASGGVVAYFRQKLIDDAAVSAKADVSSGAIGSPAPISAPLGAVTTFSQSAVEFASSTVQERGVDENDWLKTDGSLIYGLSKSYFNLSGKQEPAVLQAHRRAADGQLQLVGNTLLPNDLTYSGMYLVGAASRIALIGQKFESSTFPPVFPAPISPLPVAGQTSAPAVVTDTVSPAISGISQPAVVRTAIDLLATPTTGTGTATLSISNRIRIDGNLAGSRVIGSTLYVVSSWQPALGKYALLPNATPAQIEAKLASLSATEILPTIRIDGGPAQALVSESDCYVQTGNASLQRQITTITAFNLASSSLQRSSRCFVGGSQALYVSPAAVYFASSRYFDYGSNAALTVAPNGSTTDIHKFALAGQNIEYRGSGEVTGHLGWDADKNAYRMSEHNGDLRILTFTGGQGWSIIRNGTSSSVNDLPAASPATLSVLRESNASGSTDTATSTSTRTGLQVVATLPNAQRPAAIGKPGEQIYAVQFVGPRAYVVTFRRTDPLYVLDLSNPLEPKTVGELEIPGYSDYLFPLGNELLLGIGKDASSAGVVQGVKVALMDVADPARPSLRSSLVLGQRGSTSALDYSSRGINIFEQNGTHRIALPVRLNNAPAVTGGSFSSSITQGLARFEVDTQAKTLVTKSMLTSLTPTSPAHPFGQYDLATERSVQIETFVYYLSGGSLRAASW